MDVLQIEGLRWSIPPQKGEAGREVLQGADLSVRPGEIVTLEGPSGSGKTVLGTSALRLRPPPVGGRIVWGETDVTHLGTQALRPLRPHFQGMLQHTGALLPPFLKLRDAMLESLRLVRQTPWEPAEIESVASLLGIEHLLGRFPRHLSGGEQRRASLARLILVRPTFAFVDEPDAGLDGPSQVEVMRSIRELVSQPGAGVLRVTHQADLATAFSDRRLRLEGGQVHDI